MPRRHTIKSTLTTEAMLTRGRVWLRELRPEFLTCHAQGHQFPRLHSLEGNKGLRAHGLGRGAWQLEFTCPMCGGSRVMTTSPGGILNLPVLYHYDMPDGYAAPRGAQLTRRDYMQELWRRFYHENFSELDAIVPIEQGKRRKRHVS
jgi:hypothetical protein